MVYLRTGCEITRGEVRGSMLDEFGSSSCSNEGMAANLSLAVTSTISETNSSMTERTILKANMHSLIDATDIKGLKKPDKALPCPRCNSLDTKFCYYNNYNVNQPRHFCKGCQRYWTAGGTLRNVAVGAGRRKRKHTSLESDLTTEDTAIEHCNLQAFPPLKVSSNMGFRPANGEFTHTRSQLVKPRALPFDASPFTVSGNSSSPKVEYMHSKRIAACQDKVGPLCNSHIIREQASTFHEFMHLNHVAAPHDMVGACCNSHGHAYGVAHVEQTRNGSSSLHVASQQTNEERGELGSKVVSTTSCAKQASNESGCASSLTTQGVSLDACATDGKSDAMDSEVAKEGDEVDKGSSSINETSQSEPCKMYIGGGISATFSNSHCDPTSVATLAPTPLAWNGLLENPAFGAAWPMRPSTQTWGPADRAFLWGFPWGPAANAVDAAKAALIPNAGSLQKHRAEPNAPSEMRLWVPKTLRIKDADEAARSSIWSTLGIRDRQGSVLSEKAKEAFQCHAKEVGVPAVQSQHTNPAALTQSVAFQESSQNSLMHHVVDVVDKRT